MSPLAPFTPAAAAPPFVRLPPLLPLERPAPWGYPPWLNALTPRQAQCALLCWRDGASYVDAARVLGLSREDVATALAEAREALALPVCQPPSQPPRRRAASLLGGLLGPAVWLLACVGVGAAIALLFALALIASLEVSVELAETVAAVLGGEQ